MEMRRCGEAGYVQMPGYGSHIMNLRLCTGTGKDAGAYKDYGKVLADLADLVDLLDLLDLVELTKLAKLAKAAKLADLVEVE